jgi:hypothetical protein
LVCSYFSCQLISCAARERGLIEPSPHSLVQLSEKFNTFLLDSVRAELTEKNDQQDLIQQVRVLDLSIVLLLWIRVHVLVAPWQL